MTPATTGVKPLLEILAGPRHEDKMLPNSMIPVSSLTLQTKSNDAANRGLCPDR
jgi:hypothetical protein